jgi:GNAT superfamily N-acetyltransferase
VQPDAERADLGEPAGERGHQKHKHGRDQACPGGRRWSVADLAAELAQSFAFLRERFDLSHPELLTARDACLRGVGRALMAAFERWAAGQGCALVALATRRAAPFYRALGYEDSAPTSARY